MTGKDRDVLGVILAAGKGTRMLPFSERYPKPILPIGGKPLLVHQIDAMRDLGIRDVVIVIGHLGYEIVRTLGDGAEHGVRLRYVEQEETLGIAHALGKLERWIDRPFFLFLGDIFFETDDLGQMLDRLGGGGRDDTAAVLAVKREPDLAAIMRNFVVHVEDGRVTRVVEKPRHPRTDLKGCGLYLFDTAIFDAVRRTPRTALRDEYEITDAIQIFIDDGWRVEAAEVVKEDLNLSFPTDLLALNLHYLETRGLENILGRDVDLCAGATVHRSVVMDGARILHPIRVENALIFPGTVVDRRGPVEKVILTPGHEVHCGSLFQQG
ncbi:MAG: sugar phosphate nucleotidyltransferase [Planctomycetota bacterium]